MPERLTEYPEKLFFVDYADTTYSSPPIVKSRSEPGKGYRLTDFTLTIKETSKTQVTIAISNTEMSMTLTCDVQGNYSSEEADLYTHIGTEEYGLEEYFNDNPMLFRTFDDSLITGFEIYKGNPDAISFDQNQIEGFDWDALNVDVGLEFGPSRLEGKISIQDALEQYLKSDEQNTYILYDHGSGEIADYIAIQVKENQVIIRLYHVKKKSSAEYNSNLKDIYEVAQQAVKSIIWLKTKGKFTEKVSSRHSAGHCKPVQGDFRECLRVLRDAGKRLTAFIVIVQPSLSKSVTMPDKIQEVLAAASTYIKRAGKVQGLEIIGSK